MDDKRLQEELTKLQKENKQLKERIRQLEDQINHLLGRDQMYQGVILVD